jgi:Gpi18-like mannosyltransferase|tara:strand:+ start:3207 stop:3575 length:369 start_codon:yes stop_codon:yes gene_type:complete
MTKPKTTPLKTVIIIALGFIITHLVVHSKWPLFVSVSILFLGVLSEKIAQLIDMLWMKLAEVLGKIVPNILLSFIFFVFLFPISLMAKFFSKKDPLNLKNNSNSAWITVEKHFNADSLKDTW